MHSHVRAKDRNHRELLLELEAGAIASQLTIGTGPGSYLIRGGWLVGSTGG